MPARPPSGPGESKPERGRDGAPDPHADLSYEDAVGELETIIDRIESGDIGLEDSIAAYERGVGLIRRCREILDRAEQRIEQLEAAAPADATEGGPGQSRPGQSRPGQGDPDRSDPEACP